MPSKSTEKDTSGEPGQETAPESPAAGTAAAPAGEEPVEEPQNQDAPGPGVYEYVHPAECVYPHVPLTARPATNDRPATVFDWPFGPPTDGRWAKTRKTKPNQAADNAPALSNEE